MNVPYAKNSKLYAGLYIFFIFSAAMGDWKVINEALGGLPKVISAGAAGIAFVHLLISGSFKNLKILSHFFILYVSIIAGIILWSVMIWILDFQTVGYIMKGMSKMSFQFLNILIVISLLEKVISQIVSVDEMTSSKIAAGISEYRKGKDDSFLEVFTRADRDMYEHKRVIKATENE